VLALGGALAVATAVRTPVEAGAQEKARNTSDGVYTAAQADRGRKVALSEGSTPCTGCHGTDFGGGARDNAPALKGDAFITQWENGSVGRLFTKIRDSMPPPNLGDLPLQSKLDALAYILQVNGFPAGQTELAAKDVEGILILRKGADATSAGNFALVQVVGCLEQRSSSWVLTSTTEPAVTKEDTSTPAALQSAASKPLGTQLFELVSVHRAFAAESHKGQKMEARGFLYRVPDRNRLSLTSLQTVAPTCP
jgi:mono/diheme cytochrome c family protein